MPGNTLIQAIWGYGWQREIESEEARQLFEFLPGDLSMTDLAAIQAVLVAVAEGTLSLDRHRRGVKVCREYLLPSMIGINLVELVFTENQTIFRTSEVAVMLGLRPKQLRRLVQRVKSGAVAGVTLPKRSIGRTRSKRGWYIWDRKDVSQWHEALIEGRFNAWKSEGQKNESTDDSSSE